ncbi:MAG: hypothetical protein ACR2ND_04445 [Solirubrobacteraceae bacterium]
MAELLVADGTVMAIYEAAPSEAANHKAGVVVQEAPDWLALHAVR